MWSPIPSIPGLVDLEGGVDESYVDLIKMQNARRYKSSVPLQDFLSLCSCKLSLLALIVFYFEFVLERFCFLVPEPVWLGFLH